MDRPDDRLVVINATRHGLAAASRLEAETDGLPFVVAGHGLFLSIKAPAIVVNLNGALLIGRRDAGYLVVRAIVRPGSAPASALPSAPTPDGALTTGAQGPTITLEPHVGFLDAVFSSLALAPGAQSPAWRAVAARDGSLPIPPGVSLANVEGNQPSPFLMRPGTSTLDLIQLNGPHPRRPRPEELLFEGARQDGAGSIVHRDGDISWFGVTYDFDGLTWRQRYYVLPIEGGDGCMTLKVQTRATTADTVFALADEVAAGFEGPRPPD